MSDLVKIFTISRVPAELQQAWLQHLRDFDVAHPGCHFEVAVDAPDMSFDEMLEVVKVEPALTFSKIFKRDHHSPDLAEDMMRDPTLAKRMWDSIPDIAAHSDPKIVGALVKINGVVHIWDGNEHKPV